MGKKVFFPKEEHYFFRVERWRSIILEVAGEILLKNQIRRFPLITFSNAHRRYY